MKRYASIRLVAAAALLIASGGCKDDNPGTGLNGPAVLAIQNAGAEPLQISLLEPKTQTIDIRAVARSVSAENLTVTFKVDRTLVDAYDKAHDTSYELVPAEAYEFSKKEVILPRYNEVSSTAQVTLNSEKMPDGEQYLLPITIEQIKGDDAAQTSDEGNVYYILFNKRVLPPAQLLDREGWKVVHCTSEYTPGEGNPKTGWAKDVLDGNPASYWTYNFQGIRRSGGLRSALFRLRHGQGGDRARRPHHGPHQSRRRTEQSSGRHHDRNGQDHHGRRHGERRGLDIQRTVHRDEARRGNHVPLAP